MTVSFFLCVVFSRDTRDIICEQKQKAGQTPIMTQKIENPLIFGMEKQKCRKR
jgi:hypothetical protein